MKRKALRAEIVKMGFTHEEVAKNIGMSAKTFSLKLKKGVFSTEEAEKMIALLQMENPADIFFGNEVA